MEFFRKMAAKNPTIVLTCELDNGYIFKNFFGFNSLRGRPIVTFTVDKITAENLTVDNQLYGAGYVHGDEIGLTWDEDIPIEQRHLELTFDAGRLGTIMGRIRKKDQARIFVAQLRDTKTSDWIGAKSSSEFTIYVSCGGGGDGREGIQSIAANRVSSSRALIRTPDPLKASLLVIPIKTFKQMVDSFSKLKKESIRLCFYRNTRTNNGTEYRGRPGVMLTTDVLGGNPSAGIFEKFGEVPDEREIQSIPDVKVSEVSIDYSRVVRPAGQGIQLVFEEQKDPEPYEFIFDVDKIGVFCKLASMHNEGNVRIYYQPNCHLRIAHRFGAFGEVELCLHNKYVKVG